MVPANTFFKQTNMIHKTITNEVKDIKGVIQLFWAFIKELSALKLRPVRKILYKQIFHTGAEPTGLIMFTGLFIGMLIITQAHNILGTDSMLVSKLLILAIIRELGPLLVATLVVSRSCTRITSEIASMKITREIDSLIMMGIDPLKYLVIPRIIAVTLSMIMLTFYFQISAIAGGIAFSSLLTDTTFYQHFINILEALNFSDFIISLAKSFLFGLMISITSCYHGIKPTGSIIEVSKETKTAVMQNVYSVVAIDTAIAAIFFL